jgi:hypothetical protein
LKILAYLLALATLLTGCATTENYENGLKTMIGKPETTLVAAWGIPTSMYENEGIRYLTYTQTDSGFVPGTPPTVSTTYIAGKAYTRSVGGSQGFGYTNTCTTTFTVVNKLITSYQFKGNSCKTY